MFYLIFLPYFALSSLNYIGRKVFASNFYIFLFLISIILILLFAEPKILGSTANSEVSSIILSCCYQMLWNDCTIYFAWVDIFLRTVIWLIELFRRLDFALRKRFKSIQRFLLVPRLEFFFRRKSHCVRSTTAS